MKEIKSNSLHAWLLAARPKTLTAAVIPVLLGSALAFSDGQFKTTPALLCALFACGMQIAANFINDLFDYLKGSDREDRLGPKRACAEGWITPGAMKQGIGIMLLLSCLAGLGLLFTVWGQLPHGGWELVVLGIVCILFAFLYTTILSYRGWGDLLVLVFFGFVPVAGTYYVQAYTLNMDVVVLSLVSGLAIDTLLMVNNYRDREQDAISGKRTLVVRFGEAFGRNMYLGLGIAAVLLCLWFVYTSRLTPLEFIWAPCVYFYLHALTWRRMVSIRSGEKLNRILGETSRNMLFLGLLLAVALSA
ncbi:1,4-dihydroxy-2-naphthoate octaprenyltransferase [Bacteroides sp. GD17]|mgnify:CR=1 FL=1|jgi:1,4-dihydroxy-2-naphthoate octaprenyltransferase|uniref:1,4-dihydroxy-2-naphthoate octaprenyltransferase n=1 Tax=Bacteroides sp. GD17 TaxID=3139826 RepID=UPI0025E7B638|nr:1,4-dihydroxy-2-naphthoate octaprenyltransferase [uncultured Bacteroides sp.]